MSWKTRKRGSRKQRGTRFRTKRKTTMSVPSIQKLEKMADLALKKQVQEGLAKSFTKLGMKGVANEIRHGRNVTGNVEFGIRHGVHEKLGPRVNVETWKFTPQSNKAKKIEEKFVRYVNTLLRNAKLREMSPTLLSDLRKGDKAFERKIRARRKKERKAK